MSIGYDLFVFIFHLNNYYYLFQWRYCVRIENLGDITVQLRERHWQIYSIPGILESIRGRGVVGEEPVLSKKFPAFQYSSHVSLQDPSGHMWYVNFKFQFLIPIQIFF